LIVWVIAGLLGLATGLRIGWALANEQSVVSAAMMLALGSLGTVAALNWPPLTLLVDSLLGWPNVAMGLTQVALILSAAGSAVMMTSVTSTRSASSTRRLAVAQYAIAFVVAALSLVAFFVAGRLPQMSPSEYLRRGLNSGDTSWLLPLGYVVLALSLVSWAGLRHSSRSRRGRALFVFTVGIVLMVAAGLVFLFRIVARAPLAGSGLGATLLTCAMIVVAAGALLPTIEDWFDAGREMATIEPLLTELSRRHPDVGIGVRPHGPRVFRVAERMSQISDALFLEATAAAGATSPIGADPGLTDEPQVSATERAGAIARWIDAGRVHPPGYGAFPGLGWLRQPDTYSDREWILEIAASYRDVQRDRTGQPAK
jgi:hypothetical protein